MQLLGVPVFGDLETRAGFHTTQQTHRPRGNGVLVGDVTGNGFLAVFSAGQVAHGASGFLEGKSGRLHEPLGHLVGMLGEILEQDIAIR
jgi:hypothetical protein